MGKENFIVEIVVCVSVWAVRFAATSCVSVSTGGFPLALSGLSTCVKIQPVPEPLPFLKDAVFGTT